MKISIHTLFIATLLIPSLAPAQEIPATSLHLAALQGDLETVRQHIAAGTGLDEKDAYGSTPLIIAATFGKPAVAAALLEAGADTAVSNNEGATPLHIAAFFGRPAIVASLLEHGAERHRRNNDGASAFDMAAAPFEDDRWLYEQLGTALAPLGLTLDLEAIRAARTRIAGMLRADPAALDAVDYTPQAGEDWPLSTPAEQGLDPAQVAELYLDAAALEKLLGLLVIRHDKLVAEDYFNGWSMAQKARLQSVTKSFTSALVGIALAEGQLSGVEQKMLDFFPALADQVTDPRKREITLQQLLQMRAGYPWEESDPGLFEILYAGFRPAYLVEFPLSHDPGTTFQYSNLSSHLLGIIVARATGEDLRAYAGPRLFAPLEIEPGQWIQDWEGYYNGHADLHLSAREAARFGLLYLREGEYQGQRILPAGWVRASLKNYSDAVDSGGIEASRVGRYFREVGYGYQWWSARVGAHRFNLAWGHGGQFIILLDELEMLIVVISDPLFGEHNDAAWGHEQANLNLVGKYIQSLPAP